MIQLRANIGWFVYLRLNPAHCSPSYVFSGCNQISAPGNGTECTRKAAQGDFTLFLRLHESF